MKISRALRNYMLSDGSFRDAMNGGVIRIYSGDPPGSPNDAVPSGADMLCELTVDGGDDGLNFREEASEGTLLKNPDENWRGTVETSGTARWFRFVRSNDGGSQSMTALRAQGTVERAGGDMNLSSTSLSSGAIQTIDFFSLGLPEG